MFSKKNASVKAEIIWALHTVLHDQSAASCEGIADAFKAMFPVYHLWSLLGPF